MGCASKKKGDCCRCLHKYCRHTSPGLVRLTFYPDMNVEHNVEKHPSELPVRLVSSNAHPDVTSMFLIR